ncbi:helix-turn-helix domain-containing protein [Streptomyces sp. HGB0020]|jgi:hypothetical protein|uniref:helix-turn-helix domain-containing protein n=1 Tax=Streptomyces sp. HGB0020 TaxID=1078086 RepID=UPI00034E4C7C|nr:helix-turn-helix domain-containing protein [Streptomyces sp. HGB0020]EPD62400.1 hypothetical protein HMPREF1211_04034 [Streptomyces sp. HGB0020]
MTAMSRATRQIVVAHLAARGMTQQKIADELRISRDTVRRDVAEAPAAAADPATPDAADVATLVLPLDEPLRQALTVLRSVHDGPDTTGQNVAAARAAIRATADAVIDARSARSGSPVRPGLTPGPVRARARVREESGSRPVGSAGEHDNHAKIINGGEA